VPVREGVLSVAIVLVYGTDDTRDVTGVDTKADAVPEPDTVNRDDPSRKSALRRLLQFQKEGNAPDGTLAVTVFEEAVPVTD
jgi:hypothetical protein